MTSEPTPAVPSPDPHAWRRSREHKVLLGVCGGIAERFGVAPTAVRLTLVVLSVVTLGTGLLAYVVAYLLMDGPDGSPPPLKPL